MGNFQLVMWMGRRPAEGWSGGAPTRSTYALPTKSYVPLGHAVAIGGSRGEASSTFSNC